LDIEEYESFFNACSLTSISDKLFLLGKGKKLIVYENVDKIHKIEEIHLTLKDEIRKIQFDNRRMNLIIITNSEIKILNLEEKTGHNKVHNFHASHT